MNIILRQTFVHAIIRILVPSGCNHRRLTHWAARQNSWNTAVMPHSLRFLIAAFVISTGSTRAATSLYNGECALPPGWSFRGWKGVETTIDAGYPKKGATLQMTPQEDAKAWAGARYIRAKANALPIDQSFWEGGFLNLRLSMDQDGADRKIPLKVALNVILQSGETVNTQGVGIGNYIVGTGDSSPWLTVSIPLRDMRCAKNSSPRTGICEVFFQYDSNRPVLAKVRIASISLDSSPLGEKTVDATLAPAATPSLFHSLDDLHPPVLLQRGAEISIDANGNFTAQGRPRFLLGAEMGSRLQLFSQSVGGYPQELKWIYEKPLDYESAQRLGLDTVGVVIPPVWQNKRDAQPAINSSVLERDGGAAATENALRRIELPIYVDLSLIPTMNGILSQSDKIPSEAKNLFTPNNHYAQYAMLEPQGRELYRALFRGGAEMMTQTGANPLYYELLNEPAYDDPSLFNRHAFAKAMEEKYRNIEALNRAWNTQYKSFSELATFQSRTDTPGLFVEWCKFMENTVAGLCKEGATLIRQIDPRAIFAVQIMGSDYYRTLPKSNVNIFDIAQNLEVISLPTGGGIENPGSGGLAKAPTHSIDTPQVNHRFDGMVSRHFFLSIAEGKPIVDGEFYAYHHPISDGFWLQLARGGNAAYIFAWTKREFDWKPNRGPEGGRRQAELYPYNMLNPYAVAPNRLAEIAQTKEEILGVDDIFVPRENRSSLEIALLLSFPTARYSMAVGSSDYNAIRAYGVALDFGHYDYAVLPEAQVAGKKLGDLKVLIAPAVSNVEKGTAERLQKWVKKGGTLVLALDALQQNEWGRPQKESDWLNLGLGPVKEGDLAPMAGNPPNLPSLPGSIQARVHRKVTTTPEWETLATVGNQPALLMRSYGKGHVYFINAKMGDYALTSLVGGILSQNGITPLCRLMRTDNGELEVNVEAHTFHATGLTGIFLYNWDSYPKEFTLDIAEPALVDPLNHLAFPVQKGKSTLWLPPQGKRVLVAGKRELLERRFGNLPEQDSAAVTDAVRKAALTASVPTVSTATESSFPIRGDKVLTLDLCPFANRDFHDSIADDGKGGWTDEGENSLHGEEWGRHVYRGIPFEIIRSDMNGDKGIIVAASKASRGVPPRIQGIPVGSAGGEKIRRFYFLHATGTSEAHAHAFSYLLHHSDGTTTEIPIRIGEEVADWWVNSHLGNFGKDLNDDTRCAWKNFEERGFWVHRWTNPHPEKSVTQIDVVSAENTPIPIVIAITAELE
ncbi:MAG: beta-galactosidase trimerization domain-containing protein [Chthoniobacteraceae bacterium]